MSCIAPHHRIVALDLETTGLSASWDRIIEFAAVRWEDGRETASFAALVNPGCPIPADATRVHGITDAMVREMPSVEEILPAFLEFCHADVLVAHNARFDASFLRAACRRAALPMLTTPFVDSCMLARRCLPGMASYGLESLKAALGLGEAGRSHRALQDARDCLALFHRCLETGCTISLPPAPGASVLPDSLILVREALELSETVCIEYSDGRGRTTHREIRPLAVDALTIEAHCLLRNDTRHFHIDRIRRVWKPEAK